ncbi:hypothetical protein L207DRAFT_571625 [Hyaloscypha variabilis F]|uniref:Zn(2)-C6 fungal-type domain-containing protein n=1 Tax=Hyaloscypha variabilis (strain UAMH 11265 / GT02V1 / F) TaxID=1149755 RepID=A0A2J6R4R5_HYAVF|nr:hypothetical protein L207DRAFT_571625 [Hyaloscypha variabilis F]
MHSDDTRPKKSRKGARGVRKVKTGCLTCKIRHKKCDESLPSCSPCMSTGRKCDFESVVSQVPEKTIQDQSSHSTNLKINQLSTIALNAYDSSHFDYFINICAKEFSLYFESPVWESVILKAALTEPCIRHAALAIGAMSRNNYHSQSSEIVLEYSMKQYNIALRALHDALNRSARSWELAILGSIVFIAFEVLWGVDTRVRTHLDGAFAILGSLLEFGVNGRKYQNDESSGPVAGSQCCISVGLGSTTDLGYLVSALSRLGGQLSSFGTFYSRKRSREEQKGDIIGDSIVALHSKS